MKHSRRSGIDEEKEGEVTLLVEIKNRHRHDEPLPLPVAMLRMQGIRFVGKVVFGARKKARAVRIWSLGFA